MIDVHEAHERLDAAVVLLDAEPVATEDALGRVLAKPVHAAHPLPPFDQSAMDGYAVRHIDVGAVPARLPVAATIAAAGHRERPVLAPGSAARIFTGGVLPDGADTIVRQELTHRDGGAVVVESAVERGADLRWMGEELVAGAEVAPVGTAIAPGLVGALSIAGASQVVVRRAPRVHVLVTGDEVVPAGAPLALGQVPDANGPIIAAHLRRWGCDVIAVDHVADDEASVRSALERAMSGADLVLSSGGVSVGDLDLVPGVAEELGAARLFWKVAQKPGGPLYAATRGDTVLLGLPGNPAAVVVNLSVYVRRVLDRMLGLDPDRRWSTAVVPDGVPRQHGKTFWLRAVVGSDDRGRLHLRRLHGQGSHMLGNLVDANALALVPPDGEPMGDVLRWIALG